MDTLFARETLAPTNRKNGRGRKRQQARPVFFFMLSLGYVCESSQSCSFGKLMKGIQVVHTLIFCYMLVSLNVAINSYDYTLLSLLISNQFVEIKGCKSLIVPTCLALCARKLISALSCFQEVREGEPLSNHVCGSAESSTSSAKSS